jgi:hypothetical protein
MTGMGTSDTSAQSAKVRLSVSVSPGTAKRVQALARKGRVSANRVLVDLIETGLDAREEERKRFFALADRLAASTDPAEQKRLKHELAEMTFGD